MARDELDRHVHGSSKNEPDGEVELKARALCVGVSITVSMGRAEL
jgi:hypothetical protein